jgi:hypothetical protein
MMKRPPGLTRLAKFSKQVLNMQIKKYIKNIDFNTKRRKKAVSLALSCLGGGDSESLFFTLENGNLEVVCCFHRVPASTPSPFLYAREGR